MNYIPQAYEPHVLTGEALKDAVLAYATNPIYLDNEEWVNDDNPYRRQLRPQVLQYLNFDKPLRRDQIFNYENLAAQRLLTSIYEADLMFLPRSELNRGKYADFKLFYSPTNRACGEQIRPVLEKFAFGFLDDEVTISGDWNEAALETLLRDLDKRDRNVASQAELTIQQSRDPMRAARMWLIQFAPDFLSEASPMLRNLLGNYGEAQSEWFKIIIDEYGYGVHGTKHSTLFERLLESVGLRADIHHYWQYYLPGSLMLNNYFHYLGKNHELFFRYLGALYYTETTLVEFCDRVAKLLTSVFGDSVDVEYFTEHVHIDVHHGQMALNNLIIPIVKQCGPAVIPEILRGYEEFQVIAEIADEDFAKQIEWMDHGPENKKLHDPVFAAIDSGEFTAPVAHIVEPYGELSNTHSHQGDELCHIVSGTMKFVSGFDSHQILEAGEGTVIHRNRLHGAIIESDECVYEIHSVGDYRKCLS
jgi:nitrosourea synthase